MRYKRTRPIAERLEQRQLLSTSPWFEASGQELGSNTLGVELSQDIGDAVTNSVALGDPDSGHDLDMFFANPDPGNQGWINTPYPIIVGDSNNDGIFDSADLVEVFQSGKYEDGIPSNATFEEGDWNRDGDFDSADLVAAFQIGMYSSGTVAAQKDMSGSHGHRLTALAGEGEGIVNVSPERSELGFSVEIQVAVWKTDPNTTFNVKRAVDFTPDGVCTNNSFLQFPLPNPSPLVQLTTSQGGAGSAHIKFELPQIADDTQFDVRFEVSTADASIVLRTECFTVAVK